MTGTAAAHGGFLITTGAWPVLHLRSFERVTGPKVDKWLVRTMGGVLAAIGVALIAGRHDRSACVLGVGTAAVLAAADVAYATRRRISRIYLVDAAVELAFAAAWLVSRRRPRARAAA